MEKIKHLKQIIIVITMVFISTQVFSQFIPASVTESPFGTTVNGRATGNDILWKGGDVWEVSVWEDVNSNPGFGYNVYGSFGTTTNYVSLNFVIDSFDPDVTLTVDGGGDVWALVVYYSLNQGEYILEEFYWDTGISDFTLTNVYTFDTQSSFGTAVNIDSDYDGNFIIIWDVAGVLYSLNGDVLSGGVTFHTISKPGTFGSGTYPDVCLHHSSSDVVIYSYIDSGDLIVDQDSYSSLSGGTSTPTLMLQHTPTHTYYTTRIACPGVNVGSAGDWSVVALDTDGSTDWIITGHILTVPMV